MAHLGRRHGRFVEHIWRGRARLNGRVDRQTVLDLADRFPNAVVGGSDEIDLTKLGVDLQQPIVAVSPLDLRLQREKQVLRRGLVRGEGELASPVELVGNRHGCIISRPRPDPWQCAEAAGAPSPPAAPPARVGNRQLQVTVISNFFVIIPAIGFFMSAPCASPVMV